MTRWDHLVQAAFSLDEKVAAGTATPAHVEAWLTSVCEVFGGELDPLTDLEGFAVRRFAVSVLAALQAARAP